MKKKKYLDIYYDLEGRNSGFYLCHLFDGDKLFGLINPTNKELISFAKEDDETWSYYNEKMDLTGKAWGNWVSGLRPTIILLMAAMNGEL